MRLFLFIFLFVASLNSISCNLVSKKKSQEDENIQSERVLWSIPYNMQDYTKIASRHVNKVFAKESTVYAATNRGLSISHDNGKTWRTRTTANGLGSNKILDVFASNTTIYALAHGQFGGLSISKDGGVTWRNTVMPYALRMFVQDSKVYVGTQYGVFYQSDDEGETFEVNPIPVSAVDTISGIHASGSTIIVAYFNSTYKSTKGGLYISNNEGRIWQNAAYNLGHTNNQIFDLYVYGSSIYLKLDNAIAISKDNGQTFTIKTSANDFNGGTLERIFVHENMVYLRTNRPRETANEYFISKDGGETFTPETTLSPEHFYLHFVTGSYLYASTGNGLLLSSDGGITWEQSTTDDYPELKRIRASELILVGIGDGLFISKDGGLTFTDKTSAAGLVSHNVIDFGVRGTEIYIASDIGLSVSTDAGETWSLKTKAEGLPSMTFKKVYVSESRVYLITDLGLSISQDHGQTWAHHSADSGLSSNTVSSVYEYEDIIYVGTYTDPYGVKSGLKISSDGGQTWTDSSTQSELRDIKNVKVAGGRIYVTVGSGFGVSQDGGASWAFKGIEAGLPTYPYDIQVAGTSIYALWQTNFYVSEDGGESWSNANPNDQFGYEMDINAAGSQFYIASQAGLFVRNPLTPMN